MHEMNAEKLREAADYYRQAKDIAARMEADLMHLWVRNRDMGAAIDGYKVLGMLRKAAADLRGLKAP